MTSIVKVQPFHATKPITNGFFNELLNRGLSDFIGSDFAATQIATNVIESNDAFTVELAAPGFDKKDFVLNIENGHLVIEGKHEANTTEQNEGEARFVRREFKRESFKRTFKLPQTINVEAIGAKYENGILIATLPKKEEAKPVTKSIQLG